MHSAGVNSGLLLTEEANSIYVNTKACEVIQQ